MWLRCRRGGGYWRNAYGGGICNYGNTELIGTAKIQFCNAINGDSTHGGGVYSTTYTLTINDNVEITGCTSPSNSSALYGFAICQISGGIFDGSVFLHANPVQSTVTGGIFYGNIASNITFSESAKVDVTFATDGGSAVGAQRVIRGQKAAPLPPLLKRDTPLTNGITARKFMILTSLSPSLSP